jgi:hypothetical protein
MSAPDYAVGDVRFQREPAGGQVQGRLPSRQHCVYLGDQVERLHDGLACRQYCGIDFGGGRSVSRTACLPIGLDFALALR